MITELEYRNLANEFTVPISSIKAIDSVESNGQGFDLSTGRIVIQFETSYFKKISKLTTGLWSTNKVELQAKEWAAFNDAFSKNPNAAMESTSIGRMQVMGIHWERLGFESVGSMWDYAKISESNQLWLGLKFISTNPKLLDAVQNRVWKTVAYLYNGPTYWIKGYDKKLENAEIKFRT